MNKKQKDRTINSYATGISMPLDILEKIDLVRKDIPRSRFLLRIVENNLAVMEKKKSQSLQASYQMETEIKAVDIASSTPTKELKSASIVE